MDLISAYAAHSFWWWVAACVAFLAVEVATGTSYLLWPSASAGVVAILLLAGLKLPPGADLALFAVLTIASSLLGRRMLPPGAAPGGDINDTATRLIGRKARVVAAFEGGRGRVSVDGKEWAAVLVSGEVPAVQDMVEVAAASGAELNVRAA